MCTYVEPMKFISSR